MIHRVRYDIGPGHTRCDWFVGPEDGTLAKAGELVFRHEEFKMFKEKLEPAGVLFVNVVDSLARALAARAEGS